MLDDDFEFIKVTPKERRRRKSLVNWLLVSEPGCLVPGPISPPNLYFYYSFGPQDLSRQLDRVGNIDFGVGIAQNGNANDSKNPSIFWKPVSKNIWIC